MISRRDFLRLLGLNLAALVVPAPLYLDGNVLLGRGRWPKIRLASLPEFPAKVLSLVPRLMVDRAGYLVRLDIHDGAERMPQARTQWNLAFSEDYDQLLTRYPWVIVIHWFGNTEDLQSDLDAFMRGFDGLRSVAGREQRTSAHFLVGKDGASITPGKAISIVQTQKPGSGGVPYLASHLYYLTSADLRKRTYFIRALDELSRQIPGAHSALQDIYSRPQIDPNYYSLAIEMDGYNFDAPGFSLPEQQIANLLGLVWALLERYQIPASAVLGHDEIDLRKGDPGKKFMATVRYLLGLKALVEGNSKMCELVFGQYLTGTGSTIEAISNYFNFMRAYLARIATPKQVFEWEAETKYWSVTDNLAGRNPETFGDGRLVMPMGDLYLARGAHYLNPEGHEGLDLYSNPDPADYLRPVEQTVLLTFQGECIFTGLGTGCGTGSATVFRHRSPFGAEFVSIYGHMNDLGQVTVGKFYPAGHPIGAVRGSGFADDGYLHLAYAYSATWERDLQSRTSPPAGASDNWLQDRYLPPNDLLKVA